MRPEMVSVTICGIKTEVLLSWKRWVDYVASYSNTSRWDYDDFWKNAEMLQDRFRQELGLPT